MGIGVFGCYKKMNLIFISSLVFLVAATVCAQTVHSIKGLDSNSCNVVNVHFANNGDASGATADHQASGPPGKRGPIGPAGRQGIKGDRGPQGASIDVRSLKAEVLNALGARSCAELRDVHGISTTGYYWTRSNNLQAQRGAYIYCDFRAYTGVSTCEALTSKHNVTAYGYYLLGSSRNQFQYCPDVYTCHHLVIRDGIAESGFYEVGTPGNRYKVYCNLLMGAAVTEIGHNSTVERQATRCNGRACFSNRPQYNIAMDKIVQIINHSKQCQQYIKYRCQDSVLFHDLNNLFGYWSSRDGEQMKYWGGASSKRPGYCACGETGTCDNKQEKCNCDKNGPPMTQDEGYLTDKLKLPVTEMRFGDIDGAEEFGWHTLGGLQCTGPV